MSISISLELYQVCQKDLDYSPHPSLDSLLDALSIQVSDSNPLQLNKTQMRMLAFIQRHSQGAAISRAILLTHTWSTGEGDGSQQTFNQDTALLDLEELVALGLLVGAGVNDYKLNLGQKPETKLARPAVEMNAHKRKKFEAKEEECSKSLGTAEIFKGLKEIRLSVRANCEALKELKNEVLEQSVLFSGDFERMAGEVLGLFAQKVGVGTVKQTTCLEKIDDPDAKSASRLH